MKKHYIELINSIILIVVLVISFISISYSWMSSDNMNGAVGSLELSAVDNSNGDFRIAIFADEQSEEIGLLPGSIICYEVTFFGEETKSVALLTTKESAIIDVNRTTISSHSLDEHGDPKQSFDYQKFSRVNNYYYNEDGVLGGKVPLSDEEKENLFYEFVNSADIQEDILVYVSDDVTEVVTKDSFSSHILDPISWTMNGTSGGKTYYFYFMLQENSQIASPDGNYFFVGSNPYLGQEVTVILEIS